MKKLLLVVLVILLFSSLSYAKYVNGYVRSNGTYVHGYNRTESNNTVRDNYTYKGNSNPYTGEEGHNYYRNNRSSEYYGTSFKVKNYYESDDEDDSEAEDNEE